MRALVAFTFIALTASACHAPSTAASRAEVTIPVEGMSCGACAARLKRGLKNVDGVLDVEITLHPGAARIGYLPSRTDPARLGAAINALEFTAGAPSPSAMPPAVR